MVSLTMGNSLLPFGDGLPYHIHFYGQLLLGEAFGLPDDFDVFIEHLDSTPFALIVGKAARCRKQRGVTWPILQLPPQIVQM